MKKKKFFIIDGSAIAYRSYFGMIRNRLTTSTGKPTGAVYAFINSLKALIDNEKPDYIGMVFDAPEKTFRHKLYPDYKATRESMPDDLVEQMPLMFEITKAMNIPVVIKPGYEADDVIATFAKRGKNSNLQIYIVTGDKDFMQLLEDDVFMFKPGSGKKQTEIFTAKNVVEKWGIKPTQVVDYLALIGDSSDNVPGVKGIGPAKARPMLQQYKDLDGIYNHLDEIGNPRIINLLREGKAAAKLSKELVTIDRNVPVELNIDDFKKEEFNKEKLFSLFDELEFYSLKKIFASQAVEERPEKKYTIIRTRSGIKDLLKTISKTKLLSVDLETTSVRPMEAKIVGISLSWQPHSGIYIPLQFPGKQQQLFSENDNLEFLNLLKPVLENKNIPKCGQNIKYDMLILRRYGIELKGVVFDTMVASYIIQPDSHAYKLDKLSQQYLHYTMQPIEELIGKGKNQITMDQVDVDKVGFYAAEDADIALELVPILKNKLKEDNTLKIFEEIDMPLIPVLLQMEQNGVFVDVDMLKSMSTELDIKINELSEQIYFESGVKFNIKSPKQLGGVLFDNLELPSGKKRSTAVDILEKLQEFHPVPGLVLEYRKLVKLQNTYLDALPELVNKTTGRIHGSFNQTIAATGRLSSSDPNFQNIPIRTELGRKIRKAFIPQNTGWKIMAADYSQIELRIMAQLSKDQELMNAFIEGVDIHTRTAALVHGVEENDVTKDMRRVAKVVNFGIMYGAGPYRISGELKISMSKAKQLIDQYFLTYPGINRYITMTLQKAYDTEFVKTLSGRLRYVYDLNNKNKNIRDAAERAAINMPIQGTAADMIKIAMCRIHEKMLEKQMKALLILQVHDELVFEVPDDEVGILKNLVVEEMENALKLDVPIKVDVGISNSWYEAH